MIKPKKRSVIFILSIVFLLYYSSSAFSQKMIKQSGCLSCHDKIYEESVTAFYRHAPFEKKRCAACHLKQEAISSAANDQTLRVETLETMILSSPDYLEGHTIFLRGLIPRAVYDINVLLKDISGNTLRREFRNVIPAEVLDVRTDDDKPPVISGVKVGPVKRTTFLETTITWDTNEPSTSYVEYGTSEQYNKHTPEDNTLVEHHRVTLYELTAGMKYHFRVVSEDMFGNETVSGDFVFNAITTPQVSKADEKGKRKRGAVEFAATSSYIFLLESVNSALGVHLETTKPASMIVEYKQVADPTIPEELQIKLASAHDKCPDLVTGKELTINACYNCHPPEKLGVSHPVGVVQKQSTRVPEDLPMLEGGIITCVTCHNPHFASRQYLARREITRDICIFCHEGY